MIFVSGQNDSSKSNGSSASSSSSSTSQSPNPGANSRPFTSEQETGAKKILIAAKKSHYEVLGIVKGASDAEIKKAYRKLALK